MSLEQRVRAMRRSARDSFYRRQAEYGNAPGVTNWRMLIARRLRISVAEVRLLLNEHWCDGCQMVHGCHCTFVQCFACGQWDCPALHPEKCRGGH